MPAIPLRVVQPAQPAPRQEAFARVAPLLGGALLLGAAGGFALATVLTLTSAFHASLGLWWAALAQAHGHLQLYGWVALFAFGIMLHVLPRLRGAPLAAPHLAPWVLGLQAGSLVLRAVSQPLLTLTHAGFWRGCFILSGALEVGAIGLFLGIIGATFTRGPDLKTRPALHGILPFLGAAFVALGFAALVNLANVVGASSGVIAPAGDIANITLGLFGFLVSAALAMAAQFLPIYAGLSAYPRRTLWGLSAAYEVGLILYLISVVLALPSGIIPGLGLLLMGGAVATFIGICLNLMRQRGKAPPKIARLAPSPEQMERAYRAKIAQERAEFGPFVALIASAFLWALLGGALFVIDGLTQLAGAAPFFDLDGVRHSFAIGFLALLLCGIAPRMVTNFSGGKLVSPRLVWATLWLGNLAALLRVGSIILAPLWDIMGGAGVVIQNILFGASGPCGLALAIILAVNLWPAIFPRAKQA